MTNLDLQINDIYRLEMPEDILDKNISMINTIGNAYCQFIDHTNTALREELIDLTRPQSFRKFVKDKVKSAPFFIKSNLDSKVGGFFYNRRFVKRWGSAIALPFAFHMATPYLGLFEESQKKLSLEKQEQNAISISDKYFSSIGLMRIDAEKGTVLYIENIRKCLDNYSS